MSDIMGDESYGDLMEWYGRSDDAEYDLGDAEAEWEEGEGLYDGEWEAEDAKSRRRMRQRRAKAALARRKLASARSRSRRVPATRPRTAAAAIRRTQAEVSKVDLENKVQADAVQTAINGLDKRVRGNTNALVAKAVLDQVSAQLKDFVDLDENTTNIVNGLLRFGHVALLKPNSSNAGLLGTPSGQAAAAGALLVGAGIVARELRNGNDDGIGGGGGTKITDYVDTLPVGGKARFRVNVTGTVTWTSEDPTVAGIDADGVVTAKKAGTTNIKVETAGDFDIRSLTVAAASTPGK